jgi:hypothetical protein
VKSLALREVVSPRWGQLALSLHDPDYERKAAEAETEPPAAPPSEEAAPEEE